MMKLLIVIVLANLAITNALVLPKNNIETLQVENQPESGELCTVCKLVLTAAGNLVKQNKTEQQVLNYIETNLCGILGPLEATCKQYVEAYGPMIFEALANKVDPAKICKEVGLCDSMKDSKKIMLDKINKAQPKNSISEEKLVKGGAVCELCELVLGAAEKLVSSNKTQAQILQFIEKNLCGHLGALNGTCVQYIEAYGPMILSDLSNKVDPSVICANIGLCGSKGEKKELFKPIEVKAANCVLCKLVMTQVVNMLKNNESQSAIINTIEQKLCNATGHMNVACKFLIDETGPLVLKYLASGVDPEKVCQLIQLCPPSENTPELKLDEKPKDANCALCKIVMTQVVNLLKQNESQAAIINTIEQKLCNATGHMNVACKFLIDETGPLLLKYLASGVDPKKVCELIQLCPPSEIVSAPKLDQLENGPLCTVCQLAVEFLDFELSKNQTEAAILNALNTVCTIVPAPLKPECDNLIKTYGIYLIQLIVQYADPLKVCQLISAC